MLNIYYGREDRNKEQFAYRTIAGEGWGLDKRVFVIVPDQYTIEAERNAFKHLKTNCLMGLDVFSLSRLGHQVLKETGDSNKTFIDKYGRQMLLTGIISDERENLSVFAPAANKGSFVGLVNDFISEMKQYGVEPGDLDRICDESNSPVLYRKISDIRRIYGAYEEKIKGRYTDSEDYSDLVAERVSVSENLRDSSIWLYGFDSFAPKAMKVIRALMKVAASVNLVLTIDEDRELFALTKMVKGVFLKAAAEVSCPIGKVERIPDEFIYDNKNPAILHIESEIFKLDLLPYEINESAGGQGLKNLRKSANAKESEICEESAAQESSDSSGKFDNSESCGESEKNVNCNTFKRCGKSAGDGIGITITEASNIYNEAESAASYILHLIRDRGYRYRDIGIICNDQQTGSSILSRVFGEYGLPLFRDAKRKILNSELAIYMVSMLKTAGMSCSTPYILSALKTGMTKLEPERVERLENYVRKYRIIGTMWKEPFTRYDPSFERSSARGRIESEELKQAEESRRMIMSDVEALESICNNALTVGEFVKGLTSFLEDRMEIRKRLGEKIEIQESLTSLKDTDNMIDRDEQSVTAQIWIKVAGLLEQIDEVIGDEEFDVAKFIEMFESGLNDMEVGVLPSTLDDLMIGTMQRTRFGEIKALVVTGANEGVLPMDISGQSLFAPEEVEFISGGRYEICKSDLIREQEQNIAIYRNLSRPSERLWISYALSDTQGESLRPSSLIEDLRALFPNLKLKKDIINAGDPLHMIGGRESTLRHMTEAMRLAGRSENNEPLDPLWQAVKRYFDAEENDAFSSYDSAAFIDAVNYQSGDSSSHYIKGAQGINDNDNINDTDDIRNQNNITGKSDGSNATKHINDTDDIRNQDNITAGDSDVNGIEEKRVSDSDVNAIKEKTVEREKSDYSRIKEALNFQNKPEPVGELAESLFRKNSRGHYVISPSAIERFARCPFAYFVQYGLKPVEERVYETGGREIGDIYHAVIMRVTKEISDNNMLQNITKEECDELVRKAIRKETDNYRGGLFDVGNEEKYRANRIEKTCCRVMDILVDQARAGTICESRFEEGFGEGRDIPPIKVELEDKTVLIEGKIDRLDILPGDRVKVIDYKSSAQKLKTDEAVAGYKLQLMLYMKAAQQGRYLPAGVFYFHIKDPALEDTDAAMAMIEEGEIDAVEYEKHVKENERREFRMSGIVVGDTESIEAIDSEIDRSSDIIPVRRRKDGYAPMQSGSGNFVTDEEFAALQSEVDATVKKLCDDLARGTVSIYPMSKSGYNQCQYCDFKSICRFDIRFDGCRYHVVR